MSDRPLDPVSTEIGRYYDHEVALAEAYGAGLIWFLGGDHLSPVLTNEDDFVLRLERWRAAISARVLALAERMAIRAGQQVLDLGCGLGGPGRDIARHTDACIHGVTLSVKQAQNLVQLSRSEGSSYVKVEVADMQELPAASGSYDHVVSVNAVYHASRPEDVVREARRVLRDGGRLGVDDWFTTAATDPVTYAALRRTWSSPAGFHRFDDFVRLLREANFRVEEIADYTAEAAAFLTEDRFGRVFDEQAAPLLMAAFPRLWPDIDVIWAPRAVADLRRDILFMGQLYRSGKAVYRQVIATK